MLLKRILGACLLLGVVTGFARAEDDGAMIEAAGLAHFCGAHSAKVKDLPARLAAELTPEQRASLAALKTQPKYIEDAKKMDEELGTLPPETAETLCGELAGAHPGGMVEFIQEQGVYSGLISFYPAVVGRSAQEYKKLSLGGRGAVAKRLADTLTDPKADDIVRGRVGDAFRAIGADGNLASAELAKIIRGSASGQPSKSETVVVDPPLRSGNAVSNSATVLLDDSGEGMKAAFAVLAGMKPLPVDTLCQLAADKQKTVRAGAAQVFVDAKMSAGTTCAAGKATGR